MSKSYSIGLDYGTNSVRCLIVNASNGKELASHVCIYPHGEQGVILDRKDPNLARQHPIDYLEAGCEAVKRAIAKAKKADKAFTPGGIVGIGIDTTGSTPMPVDAQGNALVEQKKFASNPNAMAWLWKDHTSYAEARAITEAAAAQHPEYLAKCGGVYSSEWFFSKIWHCLKVDARVSQAAHTWVEIADWIPAVFTGTQHPKTIKRGICPAGHKAMFSHSWGGYPAKDFLAVLHPQLGDIRDTLPNRAYNISTAAGQLTKEWATRMGLKPGIPVAVGAFDAHLGAVGSGVRVGRLVKIIGTSTCDIAVWPLTKPLEDIPGICGIVDESVLPNYYGLEAGQSAVGDIFNWFVSTIQPGGARSGGHEALSKEAASLKPGESGLLALDWNNGNRTILVDQRLTGLLIGQTLHTTPAEIYRALIEATAFGALMIIERFEEYGVTVEEIVNCGGIAEKSALVMQIYADVTGRPMKVSRSAQTCALGAAMAGAVVGGVHADFEVAVKKMTGLKTKIYRPNARNHEIYRRLFNLYHILHDAFGVADWYGTIYPVMKELLELRDKVRSISR